MKTWTKVKYHEDFILYPNPLKSEAEGIKITGQPIAELSSAPDGFVEVILANGRRGFVDGKVKVMSLKQMEMSQVEASLYEAASDTSRVLTKIGRGTVLFMFPNEPAVKSDGKEWVSVTTAEGQRGYILANTKVIFQKPQVETKKPAPNDDFAFNTFDFSTRPLQKVIYILVVVVILALIRGANIGAAIGGFVLAAVFLLVALVVINLIISAIKRK